MTLLLRDVEFADHSWLVDLHNDDTVLRNVTDPTPITLDSHLEWWKSRGKNQQHFIFLVDGVRAGFTKFNIDWVNRSAVLGADLHASFRGMGLAKHMWHLMLEHCFLTHELNRASLVTAEFNTRAIHVYSQLGFKEEGRHVQFLCRDDRYYDAICMYALRSDWPAYSQKSFELLVK